MLRSANRCIVIFMNVVRLLAWLLVIVLVSLALLVIASPSRYEIAGIKTRVSVSPRISGGSVIALPPLGEVRAETHSIPLGLNIDVEGINQARLEDVLNHSKTSRDYFKLVDKDARSSARHFAIRLLLLAALGGLIGCLWLTRKWQYLLAAALISVAIAGLLLFGIYAQFDPTAFTQPQITGPLGSIPFLTTSFEKQTNPLDTLREDITMAARNLRNFAAKVEAWKPIEPEKGAIRILAISDLHNNPTGISLVQRVSRDFKADFIIDMGDITDFGTPLEASLLSQLRDIKKPYLFVPGNHDKPAVLSELTGFPNIVVLDGRLVNEKGVTVYGIADPVSKMTQVEPLSDKEMDKLSMRLKRQFDSISPKPFILAVHDLRMGERLIGDVPVILSGHTHKAGIEERDKTVIINPGTTGASGLDLLKNSKMRDQVYTLDIIYLDQKSKKVVAVDSIQVKGLTGEFTLVRKLL